MTELKYSFTPVLLTDFKFFLINVMKKTEKYCKLSLKEKIQKKLIKEKNIKINTKR